MGDGTGQILEGWRHDVFLSFCGKDTRKNFTDHLYHALRNSGINTFRDDKELSGGDVIGSELQEAIKSSKILVVVFSKNYTSSTWCLDEISQIVKSSKSNLQQLVFPIFYDIDASDLRRQEGVVAEFLAKLENQCRYPFDKVQSWRGALTAATDFCGWDLRNRHEAECIKDIVKEIKMKLDSSYLHVASYPVGIRSRVLDIDPILSIGSEDVRVVGICGMGGIGKTTIAKAVCNEFSNLFDRKSFLADVREYFKKPEGRIHLQHQLLYDILGMQDVAFNFIDHTIKERFRQKRVLVIIDDVEDLNQLDSVAIDLSWFGLGSRIIITTRNEHLLKQLGADSIYFPEELNAGESLELFSWHAFRASEPPEEFLELSRNVVEYCGGLPLAIEVLGAFLFKRSIFQWESTLGLLKRSPDDTIQEKLRISFDALNDEQKDIFLDIACFFVGMDKDYVTHVLDGCGFSPGIGLSVLMERCLLSVSVYDNRLMMHGLIRDMGRDIVKKESPKICGKRSRVWDHDDVIDVLTKCSGTDAVEGLSLKAEGQEVGKLEAKSFSTLRELRFLQLSYVQPEGSYELFPKGLRSLCWQGFPLESIPTNFCLQSLAFMDMQYSNLRKLCEVPEAQPLKKLRFLDLSHSLYLRESPDFLHLPNLEKLLLIGCQSLVLIHESIGILCDKLVLVNLEGCAELEELPMGFYKLKSLKTLILSGCLKLEALDDALGKMEALETLLADCTAIGKVPPSIIQLKRLEKLSLCGSKGGENPQPILRLPGSLQGLSCLRTLCLSDCNLSDELIPKDLGGLCCLEELDLSSNSFCNLETDFATLPNLHSLGLNDCSKLQKISGLPQTLWCLDAFNCVSLETTPDLSECSSLSCVYLNNCINLVEIPGLVKLKLPVSIQMERCHRIVDTLRESVLEGCAVSGYGNIYCRGSRLPNWLKFKNEHEYSFSFTVHETPDLGLTGFNLYVRCTTESYGGIFYPMITAKNHTKGSSWCCLQSADVGIRLLNENIVCACYHLDNSFLEKGDRVEVDVKIFEDVTVFAMSFSLSEAKEAFAGFLLKTVIAFMDATNNPAMISEYEHSTGTWGTIQSIDEIEEGNGSNGLRCSGTDE